MRPSAPQVLRRSGPAFAAWLSMVLAVTPGIAVAQGSEAPPLGPAVGHPVGTVVIAGGGTLGPEIWTRFVELAGGIASRLVVIPTASEEDEFPEDWSILTYLKDAGATRVTLLDTRDRGLADTDAFAALLREATGVWIPGGPQHRLVEGPAHVIEGDRFHLSVREPLPASVSSGSGPSPAEEPSSLEAIAVPATAEDSSDAR